MALQGCFDCTSWEGFKCPDLNVQVEVISDYITFCVDSVLPTKTVKTYPNNKPWVSGKLKSLLNKKKLAHIHKDEIAKRDTQREIKRQIKIDKNTYKQKVEQNMALGNSRQAWQSIKAMTSAPHKGKGKNNIALKGGEGQDMANNLNVFFSRFEKWIGTNTDQKQPDLTTSQSINISQTEVCAMFKRVNTRKSPGPDNICGNVLKFCAEQLSPVFTDIFRSSLDQCIVPLLWKTSTIIPIPKIPSPTEHNHYRPIALTSLVMKCFERIVKKYILPRINHLLDPLQFAYQSSRGVDDAILTLLHLAYTHLEAPKTHIKIIFFDFSSAFNTIHPNTLAQRLQDDFELDGSLILWLLDFLSQRVQQVKVGSSLSDQIMTNIGSPQGCVLSPLLFILYTNNCSSPHPGRHLIKFADDTALVSLLQGDEQDHGPVLHEFLDWCEKSHLLLNTSKTKEVAIDFERDKAFRSMIVQGRPIQSVHEYKCLGVVLGNKLKWEQYTELIQIKGQQRLYSLK
jgi:hypothetical protein